MEEDINIIVNKWEGFLKELYCVSKWILTEERYNEKLWLIFPHYLHLHTNPRYLLRRIQLSFQMRHAARLNSDNKHYLTTCNLLSFSKESKLAKCMQLNTFHVSSDNILWKWKEKPHTNELIENPKECPPSRLKYLHNYDEARICRRGIESCSSGSKVHSTLHLHSINRLNYHFKTPSQSLAV